MTRDLYALATAGAVTLALCAAEPAFAQKQGGILKMGHFDSPASMSLLEESTAFSQRPMMGVFNNLVMYKQDVPQNSPQSIVPDLATSWSWNEEGTELTFPLRQGVRWHDGKPFTAADVKCTFDLLMGKASDKLRINPRKSWYTNVGEVTTNGDYEATFHLKRPQPSFLALLATGWSPIYPCHVSPRDMRSHPIGTGPFKFVEFKPNQSITVARNPDYWKKGRPYLDGIEYTIMKDVSTRLLSFIAGKDDVYFGVTIPQLKDVKNQAPDVICEVFAANVNRNLIVNRDKPYLDGIEYTIIKDPGTANLAFIAGKFDMTFPYFGLTIPLMKNIESQMPQAICELNSGEGINRHLPVNYQKPPFDNPEFRRAMALSIDRQAFVDTIAQGAGQIGGVLQPPPDGLWGMPPDEVKKLPGYDPDVEKNRAEGRRIMQQLGYGPDKRLDIKVTTRNVQPYRDPAVLLIDQLKHVYIDGELDEVDTPQYFPKILRKDFTVALNLQTSGPDPDPLLKLFYGCASSLNWDGYCNPEVDQLIEQQSREGNPQRRKPILWEIERRLASDVARPILFYASGGICRQPWVKGFTQMVNSHFNGWRMEDVWLDK